MPRFGCTRVAAALTFALFAQAACAAEAPVMPAKAGASVAPAKAGGAGEPASDVGVFERYAGTWKVELTHIQTPYSKPGNESMTVNNDCWRSEIFYVCDQIIDGDPKALIVFFHNAEEKRFGTFPITARSTTVHPGDVEVDGKTVIFPWQINDNGKTVWMRIVNVFSNATSMDFRQEYSMDGKTWVAMATGIEHKVAEKKASKKSK